MAWCSTATLSAKTRKLLADNGLREKDTLLLLTPQDVNTLQLPLAQLILFRQALLRLGNHRFSEVPQDSNQTNNASMTPSRAASPVRSPSRPLPQPLPLRSTPLLTAGKALDELLDDLDEAPVPVPTMSTPAKAHMDYDPRIHLTLRASTRKALKIYNFLPDKVRDRIQRTRRDRLYLTQGDDGAIAMHSKTPEMYSITPGEWNAANMRILGQLLASGDLPRDQIELYLSYTVQVNEMLDVYEWSSILTFDARYRELQAEHSFRWGDLRMAAHSTVLQPKRQQGGLGPRPRPSSTLPSSGKTEDCKKWLASGGKQCPFGTSCRYNHRPMDAPPPQAQGFTTPLPKNGSTTQAPLAS